MACCKLPGEYSRKRSAVSICAVVGLCPNTAALTTSAVGAGGLRRDSARRHSVAKMPPVHATSNTFILVEFIVTSFRLGCLWNSQMIAPTILCGGFVHLGLGPPCWCRVDRRFAPIPGQGRGPYGWDRDPHLGSSQMGETGGMCPMPPFFAAQSLPARTRIGFPE